MIQLFEAMQFFRISCTAKLSIHIYKINTTRTVVFKYKELDDTILDIYIYLYISIIFGNVLKYSNSNKYYY